MIFNEAKIRVTIDGKKAEISVSQLGDAIIKKMKKADEEIKKLRSTFSKIGDMAQKFYFTFQSQSIVGTRAREMTELALKAQDVRNAFDKVCSARFSKRSS